GKQHIDLSDFLHLLIEIEDSAGKFGAAGSRAREHRKLAAEQLPYLARLTAAEQVKFFRMRDGPGLCAALRLGVRGERGVEAASAEWLVNGKAKVAEVMARINQQGRGSKQYQQLQRSIRRQAYLLHGRPGGDQDALQRQLLQEEAKQRDLAAEMARKAVDGKRVPGGGPLTVAGLLQRPAADGEVID